MRKNTHEGLVTALKDVNFMIQKAANLRVKTNVITECRANVKKNKMHTLLKIVANGTENPLM